MTTNASWESSRREARTLESVLEEKIKAYSRLNNAFSAKLKEQRNGKAAASFDPELGQGSVGYYGVGVGEVWAVGRGDVPCGIERERERGREWEEVSRWETSAFAGSRGEGASDGYWGCISRVLTSLSRLSPASARDRHQTRRCSKILSGC